MCFRLLQVEVERYETARLEKALSNIIMQLTRYVSAVI